MTGFRNRAGRRVGIAVGRDAVTAVVGGALNIPPVSVPVELEGAGPQAVERLTVAFAQLAERISGGASALRVSFAILPPLADARIVALPPLRRGEAETVIRRDAARYFLGGAAPKVVGVAGVTRGRPGAGDGAEALAAAATITLLESIRTAAFRNGWTVERMVPAHSAWAEAVGKGKGARAVVAIDGDTVHALRLDGAETVAVRRLPADSAGQVAEAVGVGPGRALVFGPAAGRASARAALAAAGWQVAEAPVAGDEAVAVAAHHAASAPLELVPPTVEGERRHRSRRTAIRLGAAAAVLLVVAAGVHLWGVQRELAAVRAERAAIRDAVSPLVELRDSLSRMNERIQVVDELMGGSARWTAALVDLALLLPADAYITSLDATGDTLEIEAAGERAGAAMQALLGAESLRDIRLEGVVERELENGETVSESFRISARLAPPGHARGEGAGQPWGTDENGTGGGGGGGDR